MLIDRITNETLAAGLLNFALRRSQNIHLQACGIDKRRAPSEAPAAPVLWLTGLSGAGKSTIANVVEHRLHALERHTYLLDGDNIRKGLNGPRLHAAGPGGEHPPGRRGLEADGRRRSDRDHVVYLAVRAERRMARELLEVTSSSRCSWTPRSRWRRPGTRRSCTAKARRGEIKNFTGIDSPYEPPETPELRIDTTAMTPEEAAERIVGELRRRQILEPG